MLCVGCAEAWPGPLLHDSGNSQPSSAAPRPAGRAGQSVLRLYRCCAPQDALAKVHQCLLVCEKDEDWRAVLQGDLQELTALHEVRCAMLCCAVCAVLRCAAHAGHAAALSCRERCPWRCSNWQAPEPPCAPALLVCVQAYEKEREAVYLQRVPPAAPALPQGRSIVSPLPYEPPDCGGSYFTA